MANSQTAAYQSKYFDAATQTASAYGIPAPLFTSMIQQESNWNPWVTSSKGAIGLGQLMPGTAKDLGVNPWDPMENLKGAATYLSGLFKKFGNWRDALAGYNAGPGNVAAGYSYADRILNAVGSILPQVPQGVMDTISGGSVGSEAPGFFSDPFGYLGTKFTAWGISAAWIVLSVALISFGLWVTIKGETQG